MLGLYVHIPFCARRCPYCDFAVHVGAGQSFVADYVTALQNELKNVLCENRLPIATIFFGGGTPTALPPKVLADLLHLIRDHANVLPSAEISIEGNPENASDELFETLRQSGWNRLSLGAQSFDDAALKQIGRVHNSAQIEYSMAAARRAGFDNISLDLMFALPQQSRQSWRETLRRAIDLEPEHLSCYSLTIEPDTHFARRVEEGRLIPLDDGSQADLMEDALEWAQAAGIERYEVSNYARRGRECAHNLNYWRGGDYLSAGCGAHGHKAGHRWWNERDAKIYVQQMQTLGNARAGEERLTPEQRFNEIVMLGLRLREGLDLEHASRKLGLDAHRVLESALKDLRSRGVLLEDGDSLKLQPQAMALADGIAARLMV